MRQSWKSKLFSDNNFNFYGWLFAGLLIIIGSITFTVIGLINDKSNLIIAAIYFVLLGVFGIMLQNYHSRLAEKLDSQEK